MCYVPCTDNSVMNKTINPCPHEASRAMSKTEVYWGYDILMEQFRRLSFARLRYTQKMISPCTNFPFPGNSI